LKADETADRAKAVGETLKTTGGTMKTVGVYDRPSRAVRVAPRLLLLLALLVGSAVVSALVFSWAAS
jgi:hypothetical protein